MLSKIRRERRKKERRRIEEEEEEENQLISFKESTVISVFKII